MSSFYAVLWFPEFSLSVLVYSDVFITWSLLLPGFSEMFTCIDVMLCLASLNIYIYGKI